MSAKAAAAHGPRLERIAVMAALNISYELLQASESSSSERPAPDSGAVDSLNRKLDDALADELAGTVTIGKMDITANPQTPSSMGVTAIPTILLFQGGKEVGRIVGSGKTPDDFKKEFAKAFGVQFVAYGRTPPILVAGVLLRRLSFGFFLAILKCLVDLERLLESRTKSCRRCCG